MLFNSVYGGKGGGGGSGWEIITSFSYASKNYNYGDSTYGDANAIAFKPDGTKLYIAGESKNTVYQFSLSTPRDITTATYDNKSKSVSSQSNVTESIIFKDDGLTMYIGGSWNTGYLYKYTLSTAWDISTANYDNTRSNQSFYEACSYKIYNNGQYLFICSRGNKKIYRYTFGTAWDINTLQSSPLEFSLSNIAGNYHEVVLNPQGTQMFILERENKKVSIYNLSTAWDITTATQTGSYSISTPNSSNITAMSIDNDGNSMYLGGYNIGGIYQYDTVLEWKPNEDTLAYYPLENNTNDTTGKTSFSGTLVKSGLGYKATAFSNFDYGEAASFLNFWICVNAYPSGNKVICINGYNGGYYPSHSGAFNKKIFSFYNSSYSGYSASFAPTTGTWHNVSVGYTGTKMIYSIDGVVYDLGTNPGYSFDYNFIWDEMDVSLSKIIVEKVCWTENEIAGYYNQTKANYGL